MPTNFIFILTEGQHDSAFIYRILKANHCRSFKNKIQDYPKPLDGFLQTDILNVSIPELKIQEARSRFLPSYAMESGNNLILIYSIGGDSKESVRVSILKALSSFNSYDEDDLALQASPDTTISTLYFFDADDKGVESRMKQILVEMKQAFPKHSFPKTYSASTIYTAEEMRIGAYIFRKKNTDNGMLEDILLPLMQDANTDIFRAAETFLSINTTCSLFKDSLSYTEGVLKKVNKQKYEHRKSLIGTVGQLQKSGKSNTVCISDADYLTDDKIFKNETCKEIMMLIKKVMKNGTD